SAAAFWGIGTAFSKTYAVAKEGSTNMVEVVFRREASGSAVARIAAHAGAGGALADLQGGNFGSGFLSAGVTKWLSPAVSSIGMGDGERLFADLAAQTVASATIGGTASAITGNGFGSGAQTAAFQYLFNQAVSTAWQAAEERVVHALMKDGVEVVRQVRISTTLASGETIEAIADYAFRKGDTIVFGEVKYGMDAKFTPNQKAVYAAIRTGNVAIVSEAAARALNVAARTPLGALSARFTLHAFEGSRAARQAARIFGTGTSSMMRFAASGPVSALMLFIGVKSVSNYDALRMECPECAPAAASPVR
ncbi:MAG: hypothetical protein ACK5SH_17865, partial [Pseudomonadota bacterium]